jgi:hypothetical protein
MGQVSWRSVRPLVGLVAGAGAPVGGLPSARAVVVGLAPEGDSRRRGARWTRTEPATLARSSQWSELGLGAQSPEVWRCLLIPEGSTIRWGRSGLARSRRSFDLSTRISGGTAVPPCVRSQSPAIGLTISS